MSELSKEINKFFETATRPQIDDLVNIINLNPDLEKIYFMFYRDKMDANQIAYELKCSRATVYRNLGIIRKKLAKINNYKI